LKKNILVGQSGGPTAVINASLYGVIQEGLSHPDEIGAVYGMINGIEGFLSGHTINLSAELSKEDLEMALKVFWQDVFLVLKKPFRDRN
jgi:6-phosphofructokinase